VHKPHHHDKVADHNGGARSLRSKKLKYGYNENWNEKKLKRTITQAVQSSVKSDPLQTVF